MFRYALLVVLLVHFGCSSSTPAPGSGVIGCDGQEYPAITSSRYVIPFAVGMTVETGLTNCSSSFHSAARPDRYGTDFNLPPGTPFVAARDGVVALVDEDESSSGGGVGNRVYVDHGDGTSALYLHSPRDGIMVEVGDRVKRGDVLGVVGQSGLAGYPHLHFIVVEGSTDFPYHAIPVSFRNADPADVALKTRAVYTVLPY